MIPLVLGPGGQFQQQPGWLVETLEGTTIDKNTWVTLGTEPLEVPEDTTWLFNAWVVGRSQGLPGNAGFQLSGVIVRDGGSPPYMVGTQKTTVAKTSGSFDARSIEEGDALAIQVRGIKDETVAWVARVDITPITG